MMFGASAIGHPSTAVGSIQGLRDGTVPGVRSRRRALTLDLGKAEVVRLQYMCAEPVTPGHDIACGGLVHGVSVRASGETQVVAASYEPVGRWSRGFPLG